LSKKYNIELDKEKFQNYKDKQVESLNGKIKEYKEYIEKAKNEIKEIKSL